MRANLLPDPRFAPMRFQLLERIEQMAAALDGLLFQGLLDSELKRLMDDAFRHACAHEGTLWIADRAAGALVPVFNTGPDADQFVGKFRQPFTAGIVSMVLANEQTFCENRVYLNQLQDPSLDRELAVKTYAMIATPFRFGRKTRGVISCVQLRRREDAGDPPGFEPDSISAIRSMAQVLSGLVDYRLLTTAIGVER